MFLDILKNPIVVALLAGTLTYLYLWWTNEQKYKQEPEAKKKIGMLAPLMVTIITWAILYGYMEMSSTTMLDNDVSVSEPNINIPNIKGGNKVPITGGKNIIDISSAANNNIRLINKGLTVPENIELPGVFIETY